MGQRCARTMVSGDLEEKVEVFQSYLETRKVKDSSSPAPHQDDNRRKAVQGIMKGQTPKEKPKGELSIDELWHLSQINNNPLEHDMVAFTNEIW